MPEIIYAKGIDVSHWQALSDWSPDGLAFVVVKASEGLEPDPRYWGHVQKARRNGLVVGAYHFSRDDVSTPGAQARFFLQTAGDVDLYFLDVEGDHAFNHAQTERFFVAFRNAGGPHVGLYHSESGFFDAGQDYDWVAHWGVAKPGIPWDFHQYRGSPLDLDRFHGTEADLHAYLVELAGDTMPALSSYLPGWAVTIKATSNVRVNPKLTAAKIRTATDEEHWVITGLVEGDLDQDCNGTSWVVRWYKDQWEYTSACNVISGPTAPDTDCSDEVGQAYMDGAASRDQEVESLEAQIGTLHGELDTANKDLAEASAALDESNAELTVAKGKIEEAADNLTADPAVCAYVILTRE